MNPLTTLELEVKTIAELIVLAKIIEAALAKDESPEERHATFVNRELVRRATAERER